MRIISIIFAITSYIILVADGIIDNSIFSALGFVWVAFGFDTILDNTNARVKKVIKTILSYSIAFLPALIYVGFSYMPNYLNGTFSDVIVAIMTVFLLFMRYKTGGWD